MSTKKKAVVQKVYANWSGFLKEKQNDPKRIEAYFMGAWTVMSDDQAAYFLKLTTTEEKKILMTYPIWQ